MEIREKIENIIYKATKKHPFLQAYVHSSKFDKPIIYSPQGAKQRFHSASVGKLATAFAVLRIVDKKILSLDTQISTILDKATLTDLFNVKGEDFVDQVTIEQLLSHTSGINDYFAGLTKDKSAILDRVINEPHHLFSPEELIQFTATKQTAVGKPGQRFYYSDSGFVLLAMILEKIAKKPFFQILRDEVFGPLRMDDTGLMFYDPITTQSELAPVVVKRKDIRLNTSLSVDYAGGGLLTTLEDLARLVQGLVNRNFISKGMHTSMTTFRYHFTSGMFYGLGLMELRFEKMFFLLRGLPRLQGHLGVLGVHAWINPITGDTFVLNVSNMDQMVSSFNLLIAIVMELNRSHRRKVHP